MWQRVILLAAASLIIVRTALAAEVRVIDGDTLRIGDISHRLYGIDAPEAGQKCAKENGGSWACGKAAISAMEALVLGARSVQCEPQGEDDYGRKLSICFADSVNLNEEMVRLGLAWSFRRYSSMFNELEEEIRSTATGIWQAETQTPWDYRAERWQVAEQEAPNGCAIKGNINRKGEKIYHAPWSPWYDRTKVDESKGQRWFCSEAEATAAGWRAPMWGR